MTCPVCHRTEIMPGCPNSTCPARERTLSAVDFGPSEMRLLEIGALQERVRVLEAHIANMSWIGSEMLRAATQYDRAKARHDWTSYHTSCDIPAIVRAVRERRARALSEMAAADAEMLKPLKTAPDRA